MFSKFCVGPQVCENIRIWVITFPKGFPIWELNSHGCPNSWQMTRLLITNLVQIGPSLYCSKVFEKSILKIILHFPLRNMKHKLNGQNIHPKVKIILWFQITKTQQTRVKCPLIEVCNTTCQRFFQGLQLCFWKLFNESLIVCEKFWFHKVVILKTWKHLKFSRFQFWSFGNVHYFHAIPTTKHRIQYKQNKQQLELPSLGHGESHESLYSWFIHAPFWFQGTLPLTSFFLDLCKLISFWFVNLL